MYDPLNINIERKIEVAKRLNLSLNAIHLRIENGVLPPPINLGGRSVGFIKQEIDIILHNMMIGKNIEELKELSSKLIKFRHAAATNLEQR